MKYSSDLIKRIETELENVPSIRRAAKIVGVHHSTIYKWMGAHIDFYRRVTIAIELGRDTINDVAEGVVIGGLQKGDLNAAKYWLSHNDQRYMSVEKSDQQSIVSRNKINNLKSKEYDKDDLFKQLFEVLFEAEMEHGYEEATARFNYWYHMLWQDDPDLRNVFYSAYEEWGQKKVMKDAMERIVNEDGDELPTDDSLDSQGGLRHQSEDGDV